MHTLIALIVISLIAAPGHAAVLSALVSLIETDADGNYVDDASDDRFTFDSASDGPMIAAAAALPADGSGFRGAASVNGLTGRMNAEVTKPARHGEASAGAGIVEFFQAVGYGTVTFRLDIAGIWAVPNLHAADASEMQLLSYIMFEKEGDPDTWVSVDDAIVSNFDLDLPAAGSFSRTITYDAVLEDGARYAISGGIGAYLMGGPTEAEARLSGSLFFTSPGEVRLTFDDPALFSQVPLPASGLLFLTSLAAFCAIRRHMSGSQ